MKTNSRFSRNVFEISDRIWCNKHLRHTTTENIVASGRSFSNMASDCLAAAKLRQLQANVLGWCMIMMIFNNSVSTKVWTRSTTYLISWGHPNFKCKLHLNGASDAAAAIAIVYVVHPVTSAGTSNLPEGANPFHVKTVHSNKYIHCFCVAVVRTVRFTHNFQAFFVTGIGLSRSFLSASAATQENVKNTPGIYWKLLIWSDQTKWNDEYTADFRRTTLHS